MKRGAQFIPALTLVLVAVMFGGCGESGTETAEPAINEAAISVDGQGAVFPIGVYELGDERAKSVSRARDLLMQRCLREFGVEAQLGTPLGKPRFDLDERFGLIDLDHARVYGYQPNPDLRVATRPLQSLLPNEYKWLLTGQGEKTFAGRAVPDGGCQAEATRQLLKGKPDPTEDQLAERIKRDALARAKQDSRTRKRVDEWSTCMASAGFRYRDLAEPETHWGQVHAQAGVVVSAAETAQAVADVTCKRSTSLLRTWIATVIAYEKVLIEENADGLARSKAAVEELLKGASRVASGG